MKYIINKFFSPPNFENPDKTASARTLFIVLWIAIVSVTLLEIFDILLIPEHVQRWLVIIIFVNAVGLTLLSLNASGMVRPAGIILTVSLWLLITGLSLTGEGINDPSIPAFYIIIALSGIVLGRNAIILTTLGFILTLMVIIYFPEMGLIKPVQDHAEPNSIMISYAFYAMIIALVQYINAKSLNIFSLRIGEESKKREKAEETLQNTRDFTNNLIETTGVMVIVTDQTGKVSIFNHAAEKITGYHYSEIIRCNWVELILPQVHFPEHFEYFRQVLLTATPGKYNCPILTREGNERFIVWQISKTMTQQNEIELVFIGMDISEQKLYEQQLEIVTAISASLRTAQTGSEIFRVALRQLEVLFNAQCAALAIYEPQGNKVHYELSCNETALELMPRIFSEDGDLRFIINKDEPYLNNDIFNDPVLSHFYQFDNIRALACIPLLAQEKKIGYLIVSRLKSITTEEMNTLSGIADMIANATHRAALFEQTKRDVQRLEALHQIDLALNDNFNVLTVLNAILDQVVNLLSVGVADILLLDDQSENLVFTVGSGFDFSRIGNKNVQVGKSIAGTAVLVKSIIYIADLSTSIGLSDTQQLLFENNYVSYYAVPLMTKDQVKGVLEVYLKAQVSPDADWLAFLQMITGQGAIALDNIKLFKDLQISNEELTQAYEATIEGWSHALDLRDRETEGHTQRVTELTMRLARLMKIDEADLIHIRRGALLHDIGKMGVPDKILLKPGALTMEERIIMEKHPQYAFDMLSPIHYLKKALDIPYCHHEKWDGSGYPRHLNEENIPLAARIFSVIDVWDAITSDRPYRAGWSKQESIDHIRAGSGSHFDPQVVEWFLKMIQG